MKFKYLFPSKYSDMHVLKNFAPCDSEAIIIVTAFLLDWYLKVFLRPKIRYELKHGDMLTLADIRCQYLIGPLAGEVSKGILR